MTFVLSESQTQAIAAIKQWFWRDRGTRQVFRLFGFAGTGKTTITRNAVADLGLDVEVGCGGGVHFAAFTGKAALVMTRRGTPASTIHSLIYRVSEATPEEIARVEQELEDLQTGFAGMGRAERAFAAVQMSHLKLRLGDLHKPRFVLNDQSPLRDADLLVLDEVSMVGENMAADLLAFGKPILVLGDPGQLPPIRGAGAFIDVAPDVMLTEVHRQAKTSAVIRLADLARRNAAIPYGRHDDHVWKMRRTDVSLDQLLRGSQVICGRNATRRLLNIGMKAAAGFPQCYPEGRGEKIICLKNRHDLGLINGMFLDLRDVRDAGEHAISSEVRTEDGLDVRGPLFVYKGHFDDHVACDPGRERRDWQVRRDLVEADWGFAITCHKAQGSQWRDVIVYDDGLARTPADQARWLYTAITRAERGLVLLD